MNCRVALLSGLIAFVNVVSIWSIAGMTVAMFGVLCKKNWVPSLRIWGSNTRTSSVLGRAKGIEDDIV